MNGSDRAINPESAVSTTSATGINSDVPRVYTEPGVSTENLEADIDRKVTFRLSK